MGRRGAGAGRHARAQGARFLKRALLAAVLVPMLTVGCSGDTGKAKAAVGEPAPRFSSFDLDGRPVKLADFRGSVVLLNFWASWCGPCREEFPRLRAVHGVSGVQVLGVLFDDRSEPARAFMRDHGATWPSVVDPDHEVADAYGVAKKPGIPVTWVIAADGTARARHLGLLTEADLTRLLVP